MCVETLFQMAFEFKCFSVFEVIEAWRQRQRQRHIWTLCIHLNIWHKHKNTQRCETMLANKNKWFDMQYAICSIHISFFFHQIRTKKIVKSYRHISISTTFDTSSHYFHQIWFDLILFILFVCVFFFLSFKIFSILIFEGIRCFPCWHWCLRNVNKPRKATFQRHRQRQPHPAQMEHQMANRIHLPKIFKHLSKCLRKKIGHSWQIMPNLMAWWVWAQQKIH